MVRRKVHRIPLLVAIVFILTAVGIVMSDCLLDIHGFDLAVSFSRYIGFTQSTSVIYLLIVVLMIPLMVTYVIREKMHVIKRVSYFLVFICILGTASFPFNPAKNDLSSNIHSYFAIALMLTTAALFVVCLIFAQNSKARSVSILSMLYALVFIILYFVGSTILKSTFFLWEMMFILLLLVIMDAEHA